MIEWTPPYVYEGLAFEEQTGYSPLEVSAAIQPDYRPIFDQMSWDDQWAIVTMDEIAREQWLAWEQRALEFKAEMIQLEKRHINAG